MFELVEEALDEVAETIEVRLKAGTFTRLDIGLTLAQAPRSARFWRRASLS
jgi:hypothetical protein